MQRSKAFTVVRAAARVKQLAFSVHGKEHNVGVEDGQEHREEQLLLPELGPPSHTGSPVSGRPNGGLPVAPAWYRRDFRAVKEILFSSYINLLLISIPFGFASEHLHWGANMTFGLNFLSLIPLALILGDITEDLALRFGDTIGGLINATFGNVVEVILSVSALMKGLNTVVATSLLGSILSNLLLVLGCCFIYGGINYKEQHFNATGNRACSSLLFLSCIGIVVPTAAVQLSAGGAASMDPDFVLYVSRGTAVILLLCYGAYLLFQLHTHKDMFEGEPTEDEPMLTMVTAFTFLCVITVIVACCSEYLTGSIVEVSEKTGVSQAFLGLIVLPIAGNACEHITAVVVAGKNKMDLALGVAVGSSIQIALFAIPFSVVVGWIVGSNFSLADFDPFPALVLTLAVTHSNFVTSDAASHWLLGVQLVAVYVLIALTFFFM